MKPTNTLTSHMGESNTSRADKMSGDIKEFKKERLSMGKRNKKSLSKWKKISNRKRRIFLKNKENWDKI